MSQNYSYTINVSPKRRLPTGYVNLIFEKVNTVFCTKFVQYEKIGHDEQQYLTLWILHKIKELGKDIEWGDFDWEQTKAGNWHLHGNFTVSKDWSSDTLRRESIAEINREFGSGKFNLCYKEEATYYDRKYWNKEYQKKDFLLHVPLVPSENNIYDD